MTIDEYAKKYNIRKKKKINEWISKKLIPGASLGEDYIPDSARLLYTKARAKNARAIYCSIVKATENMCHVTPNLYGICADEFNGYIDRFVEAKLIVIRITEGITYYDFPIQNKEYNKKFIINAIEASTRAIAQGITTAIVNV